MLAPLITIALLHWVVLLVPGFNFVLFYGSVFATALPPSPPTLLVVSAVAMVYANSIVWHTSLAFALSQRAVQQAYLRHLALLSKICGAVVGAFGLRLIAGALQELRGRAG